MQHKIYFSHLSRNPRWRDLHKILHYVSPLQRNQPCQILSQSVQGFWFSGGSNFWFPHRKEKSPLTHYRSELPFSLWLHQFRSATLLLVFFKNPPFTTPLLSLALFNFSVLIKKQKSLKSLYRRRELHFIVGCVRGLQWLIKCFLNSNSGNRLMDENRGVDCNRLESCLPWHKFARSYWQKLSEIRS